MKRKNVVQRMNLTTSVLEEARKRIKFLYDEFEIVCVSFSGGKDSTVIMNLALEEAESRGRLPLDVIFLDQEAEWQSTVDYMRIIQSNPKIRLHWIQAEFKLFNGASTLSDWLYCWKEDTDWIRPKEPSSIHINTFGTDRFVDILSRIQGQFWPNDKTAVLMGVRAEESATRMLGLTQRETYKGITYGRKQHGPGEHYGFSPIYDWSYKDVWKYIHDANVPYNKLYDYQYRHGIPVSKMRCSSVTHESALIDLTFMQEIEPKTWMKVSKRVSGANSINQLSTSSLKCPKELPWMFSSWAEYRDYLTEVMIDSSHHTKMFKYYKGFESKHTPESHDRFSKCAIDAILANDYHFTKLALKTVTLRRYLIRFRD